MKITKTISLSLMLSMVMLVFTTIPAMAADVAADKYTCTVSGETGTQSDKIQLEQYDDNQTFRDILTEENYQIVLVKDGAEIKFTPKEKMSARVNYYTEDGASAGPLFWTIDGTESDSSDIDANKTATVKLYSRYGGYTCDLYYVLSFSNGNNTTKTIYKVTDKAVATTPSTTTTPTTTATTTIPAKAVTATATASKVLVDGKQVSFEAYNINNSNYFKLRDIAKAVNGTAKNFEVGFDGVNNAIMLTSAKAYTVVGGELVVSTNPTAKQATLSTSKVIMDGKEVALTAYTIGGNNYFKLRDIGEALGITITWDSATNTIGIDTTSK